MEATIPEVASRIARSNVWRSALFQAVAIGVACVVPALLHAGNDGLWYRGDAARHALNGLFWWDLISTWPSDPVDFAMRYYARYPATSLLYPPAFHLIEGVAFRLIAPSPFVAKWLVVAYALVGSLYLGAWLRRYVGEAAGWGGALLALQPGVILWSNAVMLNVPAMALSVVALYYLRRWIEMPLLRFLLPALGFGGLVVATYYPAGLALIVLGLWLGVEGRWRGLLQRHRRVAMLIGGAAALLVVFVVRVVPLPFEWVLSPPADLFTLEKWRFYAAALPQLFNPVILFLACVALATVVAQSRYRRDVWLLVIWIAVVYVGLTALSPREARYAIMLAPPLVLLAMVGLGSVLRLAATRFEMAAPAYFAATIIGIVVLHLCLAGSVRVPVVDGFQDIAAFVAREAPTERILYDGHSDGTFIFYVRAGDARFRRAVVRGSKLLYASAVSPTWRLTERVSSAADVVKMLETECGCGWVVVEQKNHRTEVAAESYLRQAVQGPDFRLVRSFVVQAPEPRRVDVYAFLRPLTIPASLDLPMPIFGEHAHFRAQPIEAR